jgi:hypothetical protein
MIPKTRVPFLPGYTAHTDDVKIDDWPNSRKTISVNRTHWTMSTDTPSKPNQLMELDRMETSTMRLKSKIYLIC